MFESALKLIGNYLFVQLCIVLFILPFYFFYRRSRQPDGDVKTSFNRHMRDFFLSKQSNYLVFFWAMGEALVWFVIPEFLLLLIVFMRIRRKKELLIYDVTGTVAGTVVAYFTHFSHAAIANLPYIQDKMVTQTTAWYEQAGIWGLFYQPFSGVPYKVFTLLASEQHFFLLAFVCLAIVVRMSRYLFFFGIFVALYPGLHKYVYRNYFRLFLIATFIFSVLLLKVMNTYSG